MKTLFFALFVLSFSSAQQIDLNGFDDSSHHWYDINDEMHKSIHPLPKQKRYSPEEISKIADNILLYQRSNGGWPKNYDMRAILTPEQIDTLKAIQNDNSMTTFDNGATHSQIQYLAAAYTRTSNERYKRAALRGIDFILSAQYQNGGWPQFFPDTSGYRKYITFNDGAMGGVMEVLSKIVRGSKEYSFVDNARRGRVLAAFNKGIECILHCQIVENGVRTVWCQQHDNIDLRPQNARTFEPASKCSQESCELILFLMELDKPKKEIRDAVNSAVRWLNESKILYTRIDTISAPTEHFLYHTTSVDKIVVIDSTAKPIWTRYYELGTNRPMFCRRDKKIVYSLAEVERERRTGYGWYNYDAENVFKKYKQWQKKWSPDLNVLDE